MKSIFLFSVFFLLFCLPCSGSETLSDKEIREKIDVLYEKVFEAEKKNDSRLVIRYLLQILKLQGKLSLNDPCRESIYFIANHRLGITKYLLKDYAGALFFLEKALETDTDNRKIILTRKLEIYIALMDSCNQTGNIEKRDAYLQAAASCVQLLEKEPGNTDNPDAISEILAAYYETKGKILFYEKKYQDALSCFLKGQDHYLHQKDCFFPFFAVSCYYSALTYSALNDTDFALRMSEMAAEISLDEKIFFPAAYKLLMEYYQKRGDYSAALDCSKRFSQIFQQKPSNKALFHHYMAIFAGKLGYIGDMWRYRLMADYYRTIPSLQDTDDFFLY